MSTDEDIEKVKAAIVNNCQLKYPLILRFFSDSQFYVNDEVLETLATLFPSMSGLILCGPCSISSMGLKKYEVLSDFNYLSLSQCYNENCFTDASLKSLSNLKNLINLSIEGCFTDEGIKCLKDIPNLYFLHIGYDWSSDLGNILEITDNSLRIIGRFENLVSLYLTSGGITDEGLKYLVNLKNLKSLALNCECQISDASLIYLSKLKNLSFLKLEGCEITTQGLEFLINFGSLDVLDLGRTSLEHDQIKSFVFKFKKKSR